MKVSTLFRIAASIALVQFLAHGLLFVTYTPKHGPEEQAVVQAMQSHYFSFSGSLRSYWDMYFGYGLFAAINCLIEALLLWFIAPLADAVGARARPLAATLLVANAIYACLIWRYFFSLPGYFDLSLAAVMALVVFRVSRERPTPVEQVRDSQSSSAPLTRATSRRSDVGPAPR